jgi:hypothetical protein
MDKQTKLKGAKTGRSETVSVRLDPKLRYLAELGSRLHRRTLSSFIEWAIEDSLKRMTFFQGDDSDRYQSIMDEAEDLWDTDEPDRLVKLALRHPSLLTHEEQVLWKLIRENGYLWRGNFSSSSKKWKWETELSNIIFERLREHWDQFVQVARGEAGKELLPNWQETKELEKEEEKEPESDIPF